MKVNKKNRSDYTKLRRKMWIKSLIISFLPIITVLACWYLQNNFVFGVKEAVVDTIGGTLNIETDSATSVYMVIRNVLVIIVAIFISGVSIILIRLLIKSFTSYFNNIAQAIDQITERDDSEELSLPIELEFIEHKLDKMRHALTKREYEAQRAEKRKNDLVVYSAHDIKTPLTSIIGYLILLDDDPDIPKEKRIKYINIALDKARGLDNMIDEFFEITKYNLRDIKLNKMQMNLFDMLIQLKEEFFPVLEAGNKNVIINANEDICVYGDPNRLARVFNNILRNAIAYSKDNSTINITAKEQKDSVIIEFQNQGSHIPENELENIFNQFFRLDPARTTNTGGAGLGLAIAKEIVTLHNGTITAMSDVKHTVFTVTLPIE